MQTDGSPRHEQHEGQLGTLRPGSIQVEEADFNTILLIGKLETRVQLTGT